MESVSVVETAVLCLTFVASVLVIVLVTLLVRKSLRHHHDDDTGERTQATLSNGAQQMNGK